MNYLKRLFLFTLFLAGIGVIAGEMATHPTAQSARLTSGTATLRLVAPTTGAAIGGPFTVTLQIEGAGAPVSALQADVSYDPKIIEFQGLTPGAFLGSSGRQTLCPPVAVAAGSVRLACASAGDGPGASGSGRLTVLHFVAVGSGVSDLTLGGAMLLDMGRPPLPFSLNLANGRVTVPTPTATPAPAEIFLPVIER